MRIGFVSFRLGTMSDKIPPRTCTMWWTSTRARRERRMETRRWRNGHLQSPEACRRRCTCGREMDGTGKGRDKQRYRRMNCRHGPEVGGGENLDLAHPGARRAKRRENRPENHQPVASSVLLASSSSSRHPRNSKPRTTSSNSRNCHPQRQKST